VRRALIFFFLFWQFLLPSAGTEDISGRSGTIRGAAQVNLRSGPGEGNRSVGVLREGTEVAVERKEGSWYLVSSTSGSKGYVFEEFVRLSAAPVASGISGGAVIPTAAKEKKEIATLSPPRPKADGAKAKPHQATDPPQAKEPGMRWLGTALCIFILGWICGGNFYLRRDRIRRKKLRF
jgi:uncharacterized protein YraI